MEKQLTQGQVNEMLRQHQLWVYNGGGKCADFSNVTFYNINFRGCLDDADFSNAKLKNCNFSHCSATRIGFSGAKIVGTRFHSLNLTRANFTEAEFTNCIFDEVLANNLRIRNTQFIGTDFCDSAFFDTDFTRAQFNTCDMKSVQLSGIIFSKENLSGINADHYTTNIYSCCPEEGAFVAFKKAWGDREQVIVKLLIPEDAKRSSACSRKCRASKAKVLAIYDIEKNRLPDSTVAFSDYDYHFAYEVGKTVVVEDFDENRWNECSSGVHFFLSFNEAAKYEF